MKWACMAAASRGWRAVVLNMRGCNGLQLTSARGYNAINTSDLHVAVQSIHRCGAGGGPGGCCCVLATSWLQTACRSYDFAYHRSLAFPTAPLICSTQTLHWARPPDHVCTVCCVCVSFPACSRFPAAPLTAAGYSLGSVLLAKYLAEADNGLYIQQQDEQQQGAEASAAAAGVPQYTGSGLVAAALVSPPVCLHTTNSRMGKPNSFKFMYNLAVAYK